MLVQAMRVQVILVQAMLLALESASTLVEEGDDVRLCGGRQESPSLESMAWTG